MINRIIGFETENNIQSPNQQTILVCIARDLIVLNTENIETVNQTINAIEEYGGCVIHIFPPRYLMGEFSSKVLFYLQQNGLLNRAYLADEASTNLMDNELPGYLQAIWRQTKTELQTTSTSHPDDSIGSPLIGDIRQTKPAIEGIHPQELQASTPGYTQTSEFMAGKIAVGIILPESNGSYDASTENWSELHKNLVISKIQNAMNWWANMNPNGHLSFVYDIHPSVPTHYEPISHSTAEDDLWINDVFAQLGYTKSYFISNARDYLNAIRNQYHTDWAVVAIVADSYQDADGLFPDGYFGYTYVNPGLIIMTYDNDGWGINNMNSVMAHEFAHDFGAADEYCSPGYACCWGGYDYDGWGNNYSYLYIPNSNCDAGCDKNHNGVCDGNETTPNSGCQNCTSCVQVSCLMRGGAISDGLDVASKQQVGIRDSDGDGILDPMDTTLSLTMDQFPTPTTTNNTGLFHGSVVDYPFPTPNPRKTSVTINTIQSVRVQLDNNPNWTIISADDGSYDEVQENFTYVTPDLSLGWHTVKIQAVDRSGNLSPVYEYSLDPTLFDRYFYLPMILNSLNSK